MERRLEFQAKLEEILGSRHVYYQPPTNTLLGEYPCILYDLTHKDARHADNRIYTYTNRYTVTVVYREADSSLPTDILLAFPMCSHDRTYKSNNLYHSVFIIYF